MEKITAQKFSEMLEKNRMLVMYQGIGKSFYVCKRDDIVPGAEIELKDQRIFRDPLFSKNLVTASFKDIMESKSTSFAQNGRIYELTFEESQKLAPFKLECRISKTRVRKAICSEENGNYDLEVSIPSTSYYIQYGNLSPDKIDEFKVVRVEKNEPIIDFAGGIVRCFHNRIYYSIKHKGIDFGEFFKTEDFIENFDSFWLDYNEEIVRDSKEIRRNNAVCPNRYYRKQYRLSNGGLFVREISYNVIEYAEWIDDNDENSYAPNIGPRKETRQKRSDIKVEKEWKKTDDCEDLFDAIELQFFSYSNRESAENFLKNHNETEKDKALAHLNEKLDNLGKV